MFVHLVIRWFTYFEEYVRDYDGKVLDISAYDCNSELLVIQNDGIYSQELPGIFLKLKPFISRFKKVIWFTPSEAHPKFLDRRLVNEGSTYCVFETVHSFCKEFPHLEVKFFDNDMDTKIEYKRWLRFNQISKPLFQADYWYGNKWGLCLLENLCVYFNKDSHSILTEMLPSIIENRSNKKLFWSFNYKRRWGKVLLVYLLYKNNLLEDGDVTLHTPYINRKFVKLMKKYNFIVNDLEKFNEILPLKKHVTTKYEFYETPFFKTPIDEILDYPINLATETHFFEVNRTFTEKTIKPIMFGQIILPIASCNVYRSMTKLYGFKFSPATYDIDSTQDPIARAQKVIEYIKLFKDNQDLLNNEIQIVKNNYKFNMEIILEQEKQNEWKFIKEQYEKW